MKKITNKRTRIFSLLIVSLFAVIFIFNACKPKSETQGSVTVTTSSVSDITETSAKCGGNVTATDYSVDACGLCYSEMPNPTINSYITSDMIGTGTFTSTLTDLQSGTKYYVKAYATTSSEIFYGEQKEFTTLENDNGGGNEGDDNGNDDNGPTTGTINGHEWVDLGLPSGLKWATCNVGASSPEDYGNYFAWGETSPKSEYTEDNSITYEKPMSNISGNSQHDAATANWGSTWRMPTEQEMEELVDYCEWEWTQINGVYGVEVMGTNGNRIFLPAAGYRNEKSLYFDSEEGNYWSSTPFNDNTAYMQNVIAFNLVFSDGSEFVTTANMGCSRYNGQPVRPVSE